MKLSLTSEQMRAARALLRWSQEELSLKSGISLPNIKRIETVPGKLGSYEYTKLAIRTAFEKEGIIFLDGLFHGVCQDRSEPDADHPKSIPIRTKLVKRVKATPVRVLKKPLLLRSKAPK